MSNKNILITVIGSSNQVITELIYAFNKANIHFDKIVVLTLEKHKKNIIKQLFDNGIIKQLEKDLKLNKKLNFSKSDILIFKNSNGKVLTDYYSTQDNLHAMDLIFSIIQKYSNKDNINLYANCSGGRKTLSSMFSTAFQILSGDNDKMISVMPNDKNLLKTKWYYPKSNNRKEQLKIVDLHVVKIGKFLPDYVKKGMYKDVLIKTEKYFDKASEENIINSIEISKNSFYSKETKESISLSPTLSSFLRYLLKKRLKSKCKCENYDYCSKCFATLDEIKEELIIYDTNDTSKMGKISKEHYKYCLKGIYFNENLIESRKYPNTDNLRTLDYYNASLYDRTRELKHNLIKSINKNITISQKFRRSILPHSEGKQNLLLGMRIPKEGILFKDN